MTQLNQLPRPVEPRPPTARARSERTDEPSCCPGQMIQQQLQAGLIDRPIQPGAGRVDDVSTTGCRRRQQLQAARFLAHRTRAVVFSNRVAVPGAQTSPATQRGYHLVVAAPWTWRPSPRSRTSSVDRLTRRNTTRSRRH
ncbi:unnamed protein product [Trichogramma brassicae]|uniref:Uncharacterized protein n=1 Tax=Trichogramma brassicae TaxID=86971 RepID=A0A6H5HSB6_9HYME|nr:unnamed protein product [Trichogramma brassicae]